MMRIRLAVPSAAVEPRVLNAALEAVTRTNEALLADGQVTTAEKAIAAGVRWHPEPPGDEHFDPATTVAARGHGDCDDLAPWHAASLRHTGADSHARAIVRRSGPNKWHAIVQRSDGSIDDPSATAGMYEYRAPLQPRMSGPWSKPQIATKQVVVRPATGPARKVWCARCDVPWRGSDHAISGHGVAYTSRDAATYAISGAMNVGDLSGAIEPEHAAKLAALEMLMHGAHPDAVRAALEDSGMEGVGSFFGSLARTAAHLAPIPGAGLAYDAATGLMKGKKGKGAPMGPPVGPVASPSGGGRGGAIYHPTATGPIIVRF
jgi:hypothetical protein